MPKKWEKYPTEDLIERGNKVENSTFPENLAVILIVLGSSLLFAGLWWWIF